MEDGLTRSQMKAILKFVKSLTVADSKLLPDSVGTCWKVIEKLAIFLEIAFVMKMQNFNT
jgi:hypothetical protein